MVTGTGSKNLGPASWWDGETLVVVSPEEAVRRLASDGGRVDDVVIYSGGNVDEVRRAIVSLLSGDSAAGVSGIPDTLKIRETGGDPLTMSADQLRYAAEVARRTLFPIEDGFESVDGKKFEVHQTRDGKWSFTGFHGFPLSNLYLSRRGGEIFDSDKITVRKYDTKEEAMAILKEAFTTWGWIIRQ